MSKKRTIEEIIESIFRLVNQAKNKGIAISDSTSDKIIEASKNINFKKNEIKNIVVAKKSLEQEKKRKLKKNEYSDWSNIKFDKSFDEKNINIKKRIKSIIVKKMEEKFEDEIQKWVEKKIPRLLEIEMKKKTKITYKKE